MISRVIVVLSLFVLGSVACTAVPDPTPTPESIAAEVVTVPPRPTATASALPTETFVDETAIAKLSETPTPIITPTVPPMPELFQSGDNNVEVISIKSTNNIVWSPTENSYVFAQYNCPEEVASTDTSIQIIFSMSPEFQTLDVTPAEIVCGTLDLMWHPEGRVFLLSAIPNQAEFFDNKIWKVNPNEEIQEEIPLSGKWLKFAGWIDNSKFVYELYFAGVNWEINLASIETNDNIVSTHVHAGHVESLTPNYVIALTHNGYEPDWSSVVALGENVLNPNSTLHPNSLFLSKEDDTPEFLFSSSFVDTIPGANQILVKTQAINDESGVIDGLQLWDIDNQQLTLLISDGILGRFSPDGNSLAYLIQESETYQLYLLDRSNGKIVFNQESIHPEYIAYGDFNDEPLFTSFSPNGRFLTFYSPTPELMIYDLETGDFLPAITAVPFTPLWSPNSTRFVYKDTTNGLSIYEVETENSYPLAASGGERLSNPQWSFDGTYLSVVVNQGDGEMKTAVLQLP